MIICVWARGNLFVHFGEMAAREMASLVRQHADQLVWRLRLHDRAGVHENAVAIGDKGVECAVVDDHDLDVLFFQPRDAEDRPGVIAQQLLRLGIANDRQAFRFLRGSRHWAKNRRQDRAQGKRDRGGDGGQFRYFPALDEAQQHRMVFNRWWRIIVGGGLDTRYARPSRRMRLVWGTDQTSRKVANPDA